MDNTNYNIAIIGQTGVGKSSLINYLYGERTVETGTGRPVTTNGFHKVEHSIKGMKVNIYDSWGLEVGKQEKWLKELDQELKKRDMDKPASEWFHSIFYCISAPSARIQDADIEIIKKLRSEKNKISIVLTKADAIAEEDEECFIKEIKKALGFDLAIIPVCSESKKTRGGVTHKFGKELVEKQSLIDLVDSLILRIPAHCQDIMISQLISWQENTHNFVDKKIDFLEDYLYEYCNFGCAYFVLEKEKSEKPKKAKTQRKRKSKKPLSKDEKIRSTVKATPIEQKKVKPKSKTAKSENENKSQEIDQSKEFVIKKAEKKRTTAKRKEKNLKEQIKKEDQPNEQKQENPKTDFKIHTVKDENK